MCEWRSTRFGDICEHSAFGPRFSGKSYDEDGSVATLRTTDIAEDGRIDYSTMPRADLEHARFGHHFLRAGDLVISRSGRIGTTAVFEGYDSPVLPGAFLLRFRLKRDVAEPSFYRYYFNSLLGQTSIRSIATGSVQQNIKISSMHELLVPVPSLQTQRHIAHILGTLDDKIELNRRMNQTLEAIAQAIFKSWFIDFDPVHAKVEGREPVGMDPETAALFPDSFEDSSLGKIPKGWEVGCLGENIEFALGGDWGKEAPDDVCTEPAYCIRGTDLPALQAGQLPEVRLRYLKPSSLKKRSLRPFDLVFEVSGGSPTQSTGRSLLLPEQLLGAYDLPMVCTNFCRLVRFSSEELALFAGFLLSHLYSIGEFFAHETGTTTIKNFAFKRFVEGFDIAIPDRRILSAFFRLLAPLLAGRAQNGAESDVLSTQRDALLPQLLSGRLT
jgi:type I restriction enzyme S subunit